MRESKTDWLDSLLERRLLFFMGKGGVGRSTVSAAIAQIAARRGKRVLVCEINTKERMSALLGGDKPQSFTELDEIWQPQPGIWAVNIRPWTAMKEYVSEVLKMRLVFNLVFENQAMRYFLKAVPGIQELVFVGKAWFHTSEKSRGRPRFDLVIVDAPATGHGFAMLNIPKVVLDVTPSGPMRNATVRIQDLLSDPRQTWVNFVALPEEMPVNETVELHQKVVEDLGLATGLTFVNQWPSGACSPERSEQYQALLETGLAHEQGWPYFAAAQLAELVHQKAHRHLQELLEHVPGPVYRIPRMFKAGQDELQMNAVLSEVLEDIFSHQAPRSSEGLYGPQGERVAV